jgi:hypothetical protein
MSEKRTKIEKTDQSLVLSIDLEDHMDVEYIEEVLSQFEGIIDNLLEAEALKGDMDVGELANIFPIATAVEMRVAAMLHNVEKESANVKSVISGEKSASQVGFGDLQNPR